MTDSERSARLQQIERRLGEGALKDTRAAIEVLERQGNSTAANMARRSALRQRLKMLRQHGVDERDLPRAPESRREYATASRR